MRGDAHVGCGERVGKRTGRKASTAPRPDSTRWPVLPLSFQPQAGLRSESSGGPIGQRRPLLDRLARVESATPGPHGTWLVRYEISDQQLTDYWYYTHHRWEFDLPLSNPDAARLYRLPFAQYAAQVGCPDPGDPARRSGSSRHVRGIS